MLNDAEIPELSDTPQGEDSQPHARQKLRLLINGRFLTRPLSGVDRTAGQISAAFSSLAQLQDIQIACAVPGNAPDDCTIRALLKLPASAPIYRSRITGYAWEQLVLPALCPGWTLLSLCNMGPVLRKNQFVLIHDTQIYDMPDSYSAAFRATYRLLQPLLARRARWIGTVSHHSRTRMQLHGLGRGRQIPIIANGIDHMASVAVDQGILVREGLTPGDYLLAIGQASPHKNIAMLLRACMKRRDRSIPLVLAGQAGARDFGLDEADLPGDIRFIGRVTDAELNALYRNARLLLFPSLTEGFGLPLLEAMTCGCPVLASRGGAIPEVGGEAAQYCDALDEAGWVRAIDVLQSDVPRLAEMSENGRARARHFTWNRAAKQIMTALTEASANHTNGTLIR